MKLMSGGQTGVDRAILDFAVAHGIDYTGWVPNGGWAEDLTEPPGLLALYPKLKNSGGDTHKRTRMNIADSDAIITAVFDEVQSPGTDYGLDYADDIDKPGLIVTRNSQAEDIAQWILERKQHGVSCISVGGPRESECPGVYAWALQMCEDVYRLLV